DDAVSRYLIARIPAGQTGQRTRTPLPHLAAELLRHPPELGGRRRTAVAAHPHAEYFRKLHRVLGARDITEIRWPAAAKPARFRGARAGRRPPHVRRTTTARSAAQPVARRLGRAGSTGRYTCQYLPAHAARLAFQAVHLEHFSIDLVRGGP